MAAFLVWNVDRRPIDGLVQNLVRQHAIDVALLVEYDFGLSQLPGLLLDDGLIKRASPRRFGVFSRSNHGFRRLRHRLGERVALWRWTPPSGQQGLIVLVHGFDRRNYDDATRRVFFGRIVETIRRRETAEGHRRTIIAGDFNAHPFESAMTASDGLHAIGVRSVDTKATRKVRGGGKADDFFYNPMWRLYGHDPFLDAGAATHYWIGSRASELGWHMLDQVVLRPETFERFPEEQLRILTRVGEIPLLDVTGVPDRRTASDHLPIAFRWDL